MSEELTPDNLIEELWESATNGIPTGNELEVPANFSAIIILKGEVLYVLAPNRYLMLSDHFPLLKARRGNKNSQPRLDGAVYLILTDSPSRKEWERPLIISKRWNEGLTYKTIHGNYFLRVVNAPQFYQNLISGLKVSTSNATPMQSFRLSRPKEDIQRFIDSQIISQGNSLIPALLGSAVPDALQEQLLKENLGTADKESVQNQIGTLFAAELIQYGIQLESFSINFISAQSPYPCESCAGNDRPTKSLCFLANVSLIIVRWTIVKKGCFCNACALKFFLGQTGLTLVAGWWGLIGFIVSPFLIIYNIFNIIKSFTCYKMAQLTDAS